MMSLPPKFSVPTFLLLLALVLPLMETTTALTSITSSLMEVLHNHGLPAGLFPRNFVKSFDLDQTGRMEVHMDHPCLAEYETKVFFDSVVRANLSFGQLQVFEGMSRKELFLWFPVKDIMVTDPSSGLIVIDIGLAFKRLSFSLFEDPPICVSEDLSLEMVGRKETGFSDQ